ncbi:MAG TPA: radical SAM protein, partial [Candidatus Eisenbacteria bacterium]|nr:radical SAM protein [Candidatus Eisenbacteria bacterium]
EPLAEIMDLFAIGEAEVLLPPLLAALAQGGERERMALLTELAAVPGLYVPSRYRVDYDAAGGLRAMEPLAGAPERVARQWLPQLDAFQARTCVATADTEFGGMQLVEMSRGCPRACRFCAAGFIYRPFREHTAAHLQRELLAGEGGAGRVGLVAAAVSDYGELATLGAAILAGGGEVSVSSVRIDAVTPEQIEVLVRSGHKTLALAPEAGSQRMRDTVNKGIDEAQILAAVRMIAEGGVPNLKLYFMVGLPGETDDDVAAIGALTTRIRAIWEEVGRGRGKLGRLTLSVNPFVPKPWTPLQWAPMEPPAVLERKYRLLQKLVRPLANVDLQCESLRSAALQGLLARGDRHCGRLLPLLAAGRGLKAACREAGLDAAAYLHRERGEDEPFPWEIIAQGVRRDHLRREYEDALAAKPGTTCHPGCRRCGLTVC